MRQSGGSHGAASRKTVNRFLGLRDLRFEHLLNLPFELLPRFVGGLVKGGPNTPVDLFHQRFRLATQFIASLFPFGGGCSRGFAENGGVPRRFFLKLSDQRAQVLV